MLDYDVRIFHKHIPLNGIVQNTDSWTAEAATEAKAEAVARVQGTHYNPLCAMI